MKRPWLIPLAVLTAILAFCLWNSAAMTSHSSTYQNRNPRALAIRTENITMASTSTTAPSTCTMLTKPLLRKNRESYRVLSSTTWEAP